MKRINGNIWSLVVVAIFVIFLIINSLKLEFTASKILPILFCVIILILAFISFCQEITISGTAASSLHARDGKVENSIPLINYLGYAERSSNLRV